MEAQEIINAISSVGFPIVASGALFWMINTTMKELKDTIGKSMVELTGAINDLTGYLRNERGGDGS